MPSEVSADVADMRAQDLFRRAKAATDPDTRDVLSAAAWYYVRRAELTRFRLKEHP